MNSEFVNKNGKPTAAEYLAASIEEIVERANKSTSESEIPFVTALFAAKSHQDQKKTSNKMFYVAIVTTFIAALSLAQSYLSSHQNTKMEEELKLVKSEIALQEQELTELKVKAAAFQSVVESLKAEKEEYVNIMKRLSTIVPPHSQNKCDEKHNPSFHRTLREKAVQYRRIQTLATKNEDREAI